MNDNGLKYKIGISLIPGVGPVSAKKLIAYLGSAEGVFTAAKSRLQKIPGIGESTAECISKQDVLDRANQEIEFIRANNITPLFYLDDEYPERLRQCDDAPVILFISGLKEFNSKKVISIVGTRNATSFGREICRDFIAGIAANHHDAIVVSGLAYGIDITAHKAAMNNGLKTVAVLGHGFDTIYPPIHKKISAEISQHGALITDYLSNTLPDRQNFVKRNRIIAGMSDATVVVESDTTGGSLITAEYAVSYNRDVFAFPGRINDTKSKGCNYLIKNNKAALIESVNDLEYYLGWDDQVKTNQYKQQKLFHDLTDNEKHIINILKTNGDLLIDMISNLSGFPSGRVSTILLNLEFSGLVKCLPGKVYTLL